MADFFSRLSKSIILYIALSSVLFPMGYTIITHAFKDSCDDDDDLSRKAKNMFRYKVLEKGLKGQQRISITASPFQQQVVAIL